jgi:hypothetical protein
MLTPVFVVVEHGDSANGRRQAGFVGDLAGSQRGRG